MYACIAIFASYDYLMAVDTENGNHSHLQRWLQYYVNNVFWIRSFYEKKSFSRFIYRFHHGVRDGELKEHKISAYDKERLQSNTAIRYSVRIPDGVKVVGVKLATDEKDSFTVRFSNGTDNVNGVQYFDWDRDIIESVRRFFCSVGYFL